MFYCEECREKKNWPKTMSRFIGDCAMCLKKAICFDMPPSLLTGQQKKERRA